LGNTLKELCRLEEAEVSYRQAIAVKPNYASAHSNLGFVLQELGNSEDAVISFKRAIDLTDLTPDHAVAHNNLGVMLKEMGRSIEAETSCRHAIALQPDFAQAYNNLGGILNDLGKLEEAETSYRQAVVLKPDYGEAYSNLGANLQDLGKLEDAEASYRQAIAIEPKHVVANYNLGILLFEQGYYKEAAERLGLIDFRVSRCYLLRCLYMQDQQSDFYDQLDHMVKQGENNAVIGSLISRSNIRYGVNRPNPFCNDPLKYVVKTDLLDKYDFKTVFIEGAASILDDDKVRHRSQSLLTNGIQTAGNVFTQVGVVTDIIQGIICSEIDNYRLRFKDSKEGLITSWPAAYSLKGWIVRMKSGGELSSHMHENGWISGSIYINVPPKSYHDSGNLVLELEDTKNGLGSSQNMESIDVVTGSLCLFPSSLNHYTIPFEAKEDRVVLAFDVIPDE
jgi:Flp pilus assembly protein TadD